MSWCYEPPAHLAPRQHFAVKLSWAIVALLAVCAVAWVVMLGWRFELQHASAFAFIIGACALISVLYPRVHKDANLYLFAHVINQMIVGGFAVGLLSYSFASLNLPLLDESYIKLDALLGFSWQGYAAWLGTHPTLASVMSASYASFGLQLVLLICALFFRGHSAHGQRVVLVFILSGAVTVLLSGLFPAVGAYVHYNLQPADYPGLSPMAARIHEPVLLAIRAGTLEQVSFPLQGIITFPSYHAALGVMLIYATLPLRPLRYVLVPLNLLLIAATPIDGGHYLVDMLAGLLIALAAIAASRRVLPAIS